MTHVRMQAGRQPARHAQTSVCVNVPVCILSICYPYPIPNPAMCLFNENRLKRRTHNAFIK